VRSFAEKAARYLTLFGLPNDYSDEELQKVYRTLAKLNHPDLSDDPESSMRMVIINEGYRFLREFRSRISQTLIVQKKAVPDPVYEQYRRAFDIMSIAFNNYYGDGDRSATADLDLLKGELNDAKKVFASLIEKYPSSQWTADAIDRVFSINKWL
jgi:curved DNA-binding protein CbpA